MKLGKAYSDSDGVWQDVISFDPEDRKPNGTQFRCDSRWLESFSGSPFKRKFRYRVPAKEGEPVYQQLAFRELVRVELEAARRKHPAKLNSRHEAFFVILEELDELWQEIKGDSKPERLLAELVQVAAMCQRMAEDLGLEGSPC